MISYTKLFEKTEKLQIVDSYGNHNVTDIIVIWNPSLIQIKNLLSKTEWKTLRGLIIGNDIVVWKAEDSYHNKILETLGYDPVIFPKRDKFHIRQDGKDLFEFELAANYWNDDSDNYYSNIPSIKRLLNSGIKKPFNVTVNENSFYNIRYFINIIEDIQSSGYKFGGIWITDDGKIIETDRDKNIDHNDIAKKYFSNSSDAYNDKHNFDNALEHGWIRVSISYRYKSVSVSLYAGKINNKSKKILLNYLLKNCKDYDIFQIENSEEFKSFYTFRDFMKYINNM